MPKQYVYPKLKAKKTSRGKRGLAGLKGMRAMYKALSSKTKKK